jgi:hypothetical protein
MWLWLWRSVNKPYFDTIHSLKIINWLQKSMAYVCRSAVSVR